MNLQRFKMRGSILTKIQHRQIPWRVLKTSLVSILATLAWHFVDSDNFTSDSLVSFSGAAHMEHRVKFQLLKVRVIHSSSNITTTAPLIVLPIVLPWQNRYNTSLYRASRIFSLKSGTGTAQRHHFTTCPASGSMY